MHLAKIDKLKTVAITVINSLEIYYWQPTAIILFAKSWCALTNVLPIARCKITLPFSKINPISFPPYSALLVSLCNLSSASLNQFSMPQQLHAFDPSRLPITLVASTGPMIITNHWSAFSAEIISNSVVQKYFKILVADTRTQTRY